MHSCATILCFHLVQDCTKDDYAEITVKKAIQNGHPIDEFEKDEDDEYITLSHPNPKDRKVNGKVSRVEIKAP